MWKDTRQPGVEQTMPGLQENVEGMGGVGGRGSCPASHRQDFGGKQEDLFLHPPPPPPPTPVPGTCTYRSQGKERPIQACRVSLMQRTLPRVKQNVHCQSVMDGTNAADAGGPQSLS